jgi:ribosomal protein S14
MSDAQIAGTCRHCGRKGRYYPASPAGYLQWHAWAERKSRTHHQERCPGCGRFSIWRKGADDELVHEAT